MAYIKAHIRRRTGSYTDVTNPGGFYTHQVAYVEKGGRDGTTKITLQPAYKTQSLEVNVKLPLDRMNDLLAELEAKGGSLDLMQHTDPQAIRQGRDLPDPEIETHRPRNPRQVQKLKPGP